MVPIAEMLPSCPQLIAEAMDHQIPSLDSLMRSMRESPDMACAREKEKGESRVSVRNLLCDHIQDHGSEVSGEDHDDGSSAKTSTGGGTPTRSGAKQKRRRWTPSEDTMLVRLVAENNGKGWEVIARHFPDRTSRQVRLRYVNHLKEGLKSNEVPFTEEEDSFILGTQAQFGNRWSKIARMMKGRSDNSVKNRFYTLKRREKRARHPES